MTPDAAPFSGARLKEIEQAAQIAEPLIQEALPHGTGYILLLFAAYGNEATYITNTDRRALVEHLRILADQLEGNKDIPIGTASETAGSA
jgi:hypothetical protein